MVFRLAGQRRGEDECAGCATAVLPIFRADAKGVHAGPPARPDELAVRQVAIPVGHVHVEAEEGQRLVGGLRAATPRRAGHRHPVPDQHEARRIPGPAARLREVQMRVSIVEPVGDDLAIGDDAHAVRLVQA